MTDDPFKVAKICAAEQQAASAASNNAVREEARSKVSALKSIAMRLIEKYGGDLDKEGYSLFLNNKDEFSFSLTIYYKETVIYDNRDSSSEAPYVPPSVGRGAPLLEIAISRHLIDVKSKISKFSEFIPLNNGNFEINSAKILGTFVVQNERNLQSTRNSVSQYNERINEIKYKKFTENIVKFTLFCFISFIIYRWVF